jgi:hypothetical protein
LSATFTLFIPDWPIQNFREILRYSSYNPPGTPAAIFATWLPATGNRIGWGLSLVVATILIIEWIFTFRKEFRKFLWTACLTLVASQWIGIQTDPGNFIIMFVALGLVFANWEERWGITGRVLTFISMCLLFSIPWLVFINTLTLTDQPHQNPIMFFPLPFLLFIGLYWIRWWVIRPARLVIEDLKGYE